MKIKSKVVPESSHDVDNVFYYTESVSECDWVYVVSDGSKELGRFNSVKEVLKLYPNAEEWDPNYHVYDGYI